MSVQVCMCGIKKNSLGYNPEPERFSLICFPIHVLLKSSSDTMRNFMSFFAGKMYFAIFDIAPSCNIKLVICSLERALCKGNNGLLSVETSLLCLSHTVNHWRRDNYIIAV